MALERSPVRRRHSAQGSQGEVTEIDAASLAADLSNASNVIIVPGYGMAVAGLRHLVNEAHRHPARRRGQRAVRHSPCRGPASGYMNVLAEAGVPYDVVLEMEEINDDFPKTDVVLVIGANDIVNPGAQTDTSSPIYGMPVLEAWEAGTVVVFKRGMGAGYAGVANPLFFLENTRMLFGNARDTISELVSNLREK